MGGWRSLRLRLNSAEAEALLCLAELGKSTRVYKSRVYMAKCVGIQESFIVLNQI